MNAFDAFFQLVGSATLQTLAMVALSTTFSLALGFGSFQGVTDGFAIHHDIAHDRPGSRFSAFSHVQA